MRKSSRTIHGNHPVDGLGDRILRVNHAGEQGAVCIYSGQLLVARLRAPSMRAELAAFREDERRHRKIFETELAHRGVRRCRSFLLCTLGGFALGVVTGVLGRRAIAATTESVERVVLRHLAWQIEQLEGHDDAAVSAIRSIFADEQAHHDASREVARPGMMLRLLMHIVSTATEAVIWLGMAL